MKILAIDPGEKNIGIAISDDLGISAAPLTIIKHVKREVDIAQVIEIALDKKVKLIIVGQSIDDTGKPSYEGRKSARFARGLRSGCKIPVKLWDEFQSTQIARKKRINLGFPRKKRGGHLDDVAAAVILQSYLDNRRE